MFQKVHKQKKERAQLPAPTSFSSAISPLRISPLLRGASVHR
jgi:hypothetical protein